MRQKTTGTIWIVNHLAIISWKACPPTAIFYEPNSLILGLQDVYIIINGGSLPFLSFCNIFSMYITDIILLSLVMAMAKMNNVMEVSCNKYWVTFLVPLRVCYNNRNPSIIAFYMLTLLSILEYDLLYDYTYYNPSKHLKFEQGLFGHVYTKVIRPWLLRILGFFISWECHGLCFRFTWR